MRGTESREREFTPNLIPPSSKRPDLTDKNQRREESLRGQMINLDAEYKYKIIYKEKLKYPG